MDRLAPPKAASPAERLPQQSSGVVPRDARRFANAVLTKIGGTKAASAEVAHHLVDSDLSGHGSHGVAQLPRYVQWARQGLLRPGAKVVCRVRFGAVSVFDGGGGFGQYAAAVALRSCMRAAKIHGLAAAGVRNVLHIGRLGYFADQASARGLLSLVTVGFCGTGLETVAPYGGSERFLGTNPWSIGVPGDDEQFLFDAATAVIPEGKVRLALAEGRSVPSGTLIDRFGIETTDPAALYQGGALLPVGGRIAGHKGYGLGLAASLVGALGWSDGADRLAWGVYIQVIDPAAFGDPDSYKGVVARTLAAARLVTPAAGFAEVEVPGDRERKTRRDTQVVALSPGTIRELRAVARELQVSMPRLRSTRQQSQSTADV